MRLAFQCSRFGWNGRIKKVICKKEICWQWQCHWGYHGLGVTNPSPQFSDTFTENLTSKLQLPATTWFRFLCPKTLPSLVLFKLNYATEMTFIYFWLWALSFKWNELLVPKINKSNRYDFCYFHEKVDPDFWSIVIQDWRMYCWALSRARRGPQKLLTRKKLLTNFT